MSTPASERPEHYVAAIEALLFAAETPLTSEDLRAALSAADSLPVPLDWVDSALAALRTGYAERGRGIQLVEVGGGWELRTRAAYSEYVRQLYQKPPIRLSRAALEVLAVVAYRQPCTRADVEDIRGVDCAGLLRSLLERGLVRIIGKADDVGRPLIYGTSPKFLEFFGLNALSELPTLKEYTELSEEHVVKVQELDETLQALRSEDTASSVGDPQHGADSGEETNGEESSGQE